MKKGVTLLEFMVVIIIIGILSVMALSNTKDSKTTAASAVDNANTVEVQKAIDRYFAEKGILPTLTIPTIGEPAELNWAVLNNAYLKTLPDNIDKQYYWVDSLGTIWTADIDSPKNVSLGGDTHTVSWDAVANAESYKIGYISASASISRESINAAETYMWIGVSSSANYVSSADLSGKTVVVSAVSKSKKQSVPVKGGYIGGRLRTKDEIFQNNPPIAVITSSTGNTADVNEVITWSYAGSSDPDGDTITNAEWVGNQNSFPAEGTYTVQLRVQDSKGLWSNWTSVDLVVSEVAAPNQKPNAVITMTPNTGITTETSITWGYGSSSDPDGDSIVSAEWQLDSNSVITSPDGVVASAGNHTMKLRVKDSENNWSDWVSKSFTVDAVNHKPTAVITSSPNTDIKTTTNITWSYASSVDSDGDSIVAAEWIGKQDVYNIAGDYTVQLRVQDSKGLWSDYDTAIITVTQGLTVKQIETSDYATFVLYSDGVLKGFGHNGSGQLGLPVQETVSFPDPVTILTDVEQISATSGLGIALMKDGTVKSWGDDWYGETGIATAEPGNVAVAATTIPGISDAKQVAMGSDFALVLLNNGTVKSFGNNSSGQLGNSVNYEVVARNSTPTTIAGLTNVKSIAVGYSHAFAILNDGTVKGWGANDVGQLSNSVGVNHTNVPTTIGGLTNVNKIVPGARYTTVLLADGTYKAFGSNDYSELGISNATPYTGTPVTNATLNAAIVVDIFTADTTTYFKLANNSIVTYDWNAGSLVEVFADTYNITSLTGSDFYLIAAQPDMTLWGKGWNYDGQIGNTNFGGTVDAWQIVE